MAISRMQQPRQNYGLGSFVKKLTRKVTKPFTKVARKLVPKEIAGIMRIAAPFVSGPAGSLMYLAGTAKQKGRISPMDLALTAAPYVGKINLPTEGRLARFIPKNLQDLTIKQAIGRTPLPFTDRNLEQLLVGKKYASPEDKDALTGLFGKGGEMYKFGGGGRKGDVGIFDTKAGQKLFGRKLDDGTFAPSFAKIVPQLLTAGEFIRANKELEKLARDAGNEGLIDDLITTGGVTDSEAYQKFLERLAALNEESFRVPERLRLPAKGGGLMRTNFAIGSGDEDPKPLPNDPTEPVNPFRPKPIGPFPSKRASVDDPFYRDSEGDRDEHSFRMFNKPYKELNENELKEFQEEMMRLMNKFSKSKSEGIMMAGSDRYQRILEEIINEMEDALGRELTNEEYDLAGQLAYDKLNSPPGSIDYAKGGRVNYALGTRPTAQESGLGGLPIEADMRYTGGFMPYGAKEKADDVPARLSKNEFVFTADAVRAAGGGSVNKGAKKMYQTMKQLEAKPEAKGMTA